MKAGVLSDPGCSVLPVGTADGRPGSLSVTAAPGTHSDLPRTWPTLTCKACLIDADESNFCPCCGLIVRAAANRLEAA